VLLACEDGYFDRNMNPTDGCEYMCSYTGPTEICNGQDDNCNGTIDEGVTPPMGFCRTVGACAGATASCMGAMGFRCSYGGTVEIDSMTGQPVAVETRCNGLDDNCNGAADESFPGLGTACSSGGVGTCNRTGTFICNMAGTGTQCSVTTSGSPTSELCNGLDDDCDGTADENRTSPGSNASYVAASWIQTTSNLWVMQYEASRPGATVGSQGTLSNRACSVSSVLPWTNLTPAAAATACSNAGARLCTETEWQAACRSSTNMCAWSYASSCGTYGLTTCNGYDNDINPGMTGRQNGLVPTGSMGNCYASWGGSNRIHDLSGNAKEFTSPRSAGVNPLRGGGYNSIAVGTSCDFAWTTVSDTFTFVHTGFRCCYSGATAP